jgi:fumarylacetoacetase
MDHTHDPQLRSWLPSANQPSGDFPIQNLPLGIFRRAGSAEGARVGVAIGDQVLDLAACAGAGLIESDVAAHCRSAQLNGLLSLGRDASRRLRHQVSAALREGAEPLPALLVPMSDAELLLPAQIGDYTDAYASLHHATNVGRLFRPERPLLPNYKHVPIAYHGRASSLVASGTAIRRPSGQRQSGDAPPTFGPSAELDYEAEVGMLVGPGNALGEPVPIGDAGAQIFGLCLVNDWSARDIQRWEYQPLGPFLGKSFATSVSPWVVTMEGLEPFRVSASPRPPGDPRPLPYLLDDADQRAGGVALTVEVWLHTARMRERGLAAVRLSRASLADLYWTPAQLVAHHASNGCNLRPGDLIATGTVSGAGPDARSCLLELTRGGREPVALPDGEVRRYLEDGDEVTLRGYCEREGFARIGFGECRGVVMPQ